MKTFVLIAASLLAGLVSVAVDAEDFVAAGVVVDINRFFEVLEKESAGLSGVVQPHTAGRALVTADGIFAFLESPENVALLKDITPGTQVNVKGKVFMPSAILQAESITKDTGKITIDLKKFSENPGKKVTLSGINLCQCSLKLGGLPLSCKLGHLHHLSYAGGHAHYLQSGAGKKVHNGRHSQKVKIVGRLFPGNYLFVEEVQ